MKRLFRLSMVLFILAGSVAFPNPANACSCAPSGTPQQEFSQADAVFVGKVVGSGNNLLNIFQNTLAQYIPFIPYHFSGSRTFTFNVSTSWKGVTQNSVIISTGAGDADCGDSFASGTDYVVYAYRSGVELTTNICRRTAQTGSAPQDLAYLNTLPSLSLTTSYRPYLPSLLCGGLLTGSIILLLLLIRRRKNLASSSE